MHLGSALNVSNPIEYYDQVTRLSQNFYMCILPVSVFIIFHNNNLKQKK